jgi:hypothetical protein
LQTLLGPSPLDRSRGSDRRTVPPSMGIPTWPRHASTPTPGLSKARGFAKAGRRGLPEFEPGSRPGQGRMLAGLHYVGTVVAPAGIEPANSGFKVRRPSPTETPGLGVAAAIAAGLLANDFRALSADGVRSTLYRNERKPISREPASHTRIRLCTERVLDKGRRQSRVPRPLTGSPYGGRVMRVRVSGRRRNASNSRIRSRRRSGGLRPVSSHADLVGTRRTRDPRLSENEYAAWWGEF